MNTRKQNGPDKGTVHNVSRAGGPGKTHQKSESSKDAASVTSKSTSGAAQRNKILALLRRGVKTTIDLRKHGILMPAARVFELKLLGHIIVTTLLTLYDEHGFRHRKVAQYRLIQEAPQQFELPGADRG